MTLYKYLVPSSESLTFFIYFKLFIMHINIKNLPMKYIAH
jgi:hypothetical protein